MEKEAIFPPHLAFPYARESAAIESGELACLSPVLSAALLRAAFLDEEEDVRAAASHALILHGGELGDTLLLALAMDRDADVRISTLDEANEVRDPARRTRLIRLVVTILLRDESETVRARASSFADV